MVSHCALRATAPPGLLVPTRHRWGKPRNDPRHIQHKPRHTNYWAPRTRKQHPQEHRPQRPTERSDPTQHAKGRTGDCSRPCKGTTTRRNVTLDPPPPYPPPFGQSNILPGACGVSWFGPKLVFGAFGASKNSAPLGVGWLGGGMRGLDRPPPPNNRSPRRPPSMRRVCWDSTPNRDQWALGSVVKLSKKNFF